MASVALVGGTGLVGSHILTTLLHHSSIAHIEFLARRLPPESITKSNPTKLSTFTSKDPPATWTSHLRTDTHPLINIFFSTLATTRANAGGLAAQRAIEHDANVELARAAKEAGAKVYVLVSSAGANVSSSFPYLKLKGDIEESILALGFERTVILRPQLIGGQRAETRLAEGLLRGIAGVAGWINKPLLKDWWCQDAEEIARAAVSAGLKAWKGEGGQGQQGVIVLDGKDIIRLGRTEWKPDIS
ncbi:NAD dependent epimerase/dehydratase family protein [Paracoccidioides lutzii Pb01]|uniref:NAD dependent epimerase/dehydratase family protein n=1 Tax=Paracoccidioides lutzii (strain ATCC MYA-826 / Pb01) TaxID=502779 RepID=C1HBK4_PARBA|nr:NAD dependent epimerase/dehydratase family protein [Paracoccidioides lutzii Pb01]EEH38418.1 NAD dependent epimerase/dehydratase family protein [Paracoccidioides lutzii Pb01]